MHNLSNVWNTLRTKLSFPRKKQKTRGRQNQFGRRLRMEALECRQLLAITVNTTVDELDGSITDGDVSLRDAVDLATAGETINFAPSLNGATITLLPNLGQIEFDQSLTIDASMLSLGIKIDAGNGTDQTPFTGDGFRIFNITDPTSGTNPPLVTMIGLTLTGADSGFSHGGAIRSAGMLTLQEMVIVENGAASEGAAVYVEVVGTGERDVLTIENSTLDENSAGTHGGAVSVRFSVHTGATDTVRINGTSLSNNLAGARGGALYINNNVGFGSSGNHAVIISSSTLDSNEADVGGAVYHRSRDTSRVDLSILQGSLVTGNTATNGSGGGVHSLIYGSDLRIENSTFSGNHADAGNGQGGGVFAQLKESASLSIIESEISGNTAGNDGGGVYAKAFTDSSNLFPTPRAITISRSLISGNTALNRGGGLYAFNFQGTETLVEESRVTGNMVPNTNPYNYRNGGGIYAYVRGNFGDDTYNPRFTITRSTVDNNEAQHEGGGIFVCGKFFGEFVATNTTISGNRTLDQSAGGGGGMFISRFGGPGIDADLRNITVTQNTSVNGGGIHAADLDGVRVRIANSIISQNFNHQAPPNNKSNLVGRLDIANTKYNLVGTGSTILNLNGNSATLDMTNITGIPADSPLLGTLSNNNGGPTPTHALLTGSPAIDTGDPDFELPPFTDQRGAPYLRVYDGDGNMDAVIDIGAYELQPDPGPFLLGDYNRNGVVDTADYTLWRDTRGAIVTPFSGADGDGSGVIDQADYEVWRENFGNTLPNDIDILYDNLKSGLPNPTQADGDLDGDGDIDVDDLDRAFAQFGMELSVVS